MPEWLGSSNVPQLKFSHMSVSTIHTSDNRFIRHRFLSLSPTSTTIFERSFDMLTKKYFVPVRVKEVIDEETGEILEVKEEIKPPTFKSHVGELSDKARRQLNKSVYTLLQIVDPELLINPTKENKQKITFATLTLASSQIKEIHTHYVDYYATDKEIKANCFNHLLTELRETQGVQNYVWVSEKQKNGSIHFHLLLDKRIDYTWLRKRWNVIQNKFGFVDRYQSRMAKLSKSEYFQLRKKDFKKVSEKEIKQIENAWNYGQKTNWSDPNSTDIETLKHVDNVASYISKYMSKSYGHNPEQQKKYVSRLSGQIEISDICAKMFHTIEGRIWQCSQNISKCRKVIVECEDYHETAISNMKKQIKDCKVYVDERFITILHNTKQLFKHAHQIYNDYCTAIETRLTLISDSINSAINICCSDSILSPIQDKENDSTINSQTHILYT